MQISERTVDGVVIVDVSGKVTLGDGGDVTLADAAKAAGGANTRVSCMTDSIVLIVGLP